MAQADGDRQHGQFQQHSQHGQYSTSNRDNYRQKAQGKRHEMRENMRKHRQAVHQKAQGKRHEMRGNRQHIMSMGGMRNR